MNIDVELSLQEDEFNYFRYKPTSAIAGPYIWQFYFFENLHAFFHSDCTVLHSHQLRKVVVISPPSPILVFLIIAILTGVRWSIIMIPIYIFLMISDIKHLFVYLSASHRFLEKCLQFPCLFFFKSIYLLICRSSLNILEMNSLLNTFSHSISYFFSPLSVPNTEAYYSEVPLLYFCFCCLCFQLLTHEILAKEPFSTSTLSSLNSFIVLGLMFKSLIIFSRFSYMTSYLPDNPKGN